MADRHDLPAGRLYRPCDPSTLGFETTEELEPLVGALGQDDAMAALEFGLAVDAPGFNLFAVGAPGSGRLSFIRQALERHAAGEPTPSDWCYVFNFDDPRKPRALELPTGRAREFATDMRELVDALRASIPRALQSDEVARRRSALLEQHEKAAADALEALRREVEADPSVALVGGPEAILVAPARGGEPLEGEAYLRLPEAERERIGQHLREARDRVLSAQRKIQELRRDAQSRIAALDQEVARSVVEQRTAVLKDKYREVAGVVSHLDRLVEDVVHHAERFTTLPGEEPAAERMLLFGVAGADDFFKRYLVNPLLQREPGSGAPVVEERDPSLSRLLGRIDRQMQLGAVITDFTRIVAGAMHRAIGGYLILEVDEVLRRPLVWPALKRVLQSGELRPADIGAEIGLIVTESLEPEPIPPRLKVVLIGEEVLFTLLYALDSEFQELFKVKADFRPEMERSPETERGYARFVAARCRDESLPPFEAGAVAVIIEEGSRSAEDQRKLTTRFAEVADLVRESAHWAHAAGRDRVAAADVDRALAERDRRNKRRHRELLELIDRGILAFDPVGEAVGQLYGIGLIAITDGLVGRPIRVMAGAFLGTGGVINIEREARLSGPIHSKGFLVLSGYLGWRFARTHPLILSANLSFDQLYEEVEGDSASAAELFALMSAIGGVPLRQGIAVTGAINQTGLILPVGGITQKVEGFFAACERSGLTGEQGVVLPRRNIENLALRPDVRAAVDAGRFHVFAIDRIEEGWPILTGREAGEPAPDGTFPEGTVHRAVADRLAAWAREWQKFAATPSPRPGGEGGPPARPGIGSSAE